MAIYTNSAGVFQGQTLYCRYGIPGKISPAPHIHTIRLPCIDQLYLSRQLVCYVVIFPIALVIFGFVIFAGLALNSPSPRVKGCNSAGIDAGRPWPADARKLER